jgi:hypothetical protein
MQQDQKVLHFLGHFSKEIKHRKNLFIRLVWLLNIKLVKKINK